MNHIVFFLILVSFFTFSCQHNSSSGVKTALRLAGNNRSELEKVLDHYQQNKADSLKLRAACFLIENMPSYFWQTGLNQFDAVFDSIAKIPAISVRRETFRQLLDSVAQIPSSDYPRVIRDIEILDADYLIENIDLAFEAWYRHPAEKRDNFNTFCNFILPYRNYNEPVERGTRRRFIEEYRWVFDSLENNVPLKTIADQIINPFKFALSNFRSQYPLPLSIKQFKACRMGLCTDEVNYFIHLFRALGIVSSEEFIPYYGNSYSTGHSFLRLEYSNEIYCEGNLLEVYKEESIPKVYRRTYSKVVTKPGDTCLYKDVNQQYKTTIDVELDLVLNKPAKHNRPGIYVFAPRTQWLRVAEGFWKDNKFLFKNIGTNVLYFEVAKNSLLWLRNLSRGKEENTFVIDENGKQYWLGFSNE